MSFFVRIPQVVTRPTKLMGRESGKPLHEQLVLVCHPQQFTPVQDSVLLEEGQQPYQPGEYHLGWESITAGKYGRSEFRLKIGELIRQAKAA
ncbi:single-stranded DNA-binding protein [Algiphilus sp.]|uniref:single-stranded DNA-binding protein n=1 Tax=Algiphilus sp. TaxID=1872431 RepID=UPI0025C132FB|nr:single-stranded DNA-binding protein [Algiphilus sp.]MCK5770834.1 hypothetical protein [Algiphilus sp.]